MVVTLSFYSCTLYTNDCLSFLFSDNLTDARLFHLEKTEGNTGVQMIIDSKTQYVANLRTELLTMNSLFSCGNIPPAIEDVDEYDKLLDSDADDVDDEDEDEEIVNVYTQADAHFSGTHPFYTNVSNIHYTFAMLHIF